RFYAFTAGDPKQLDAVTKSELANVLGFGKSLMEHLLEGTLYKRDPKTDTYNKQFVTMLVRNYRSHEDILYIPNKLYYDQKLKAEAPENITHLINNESLSSPVVFHSIRGECKKPRANSSSYNAEEIEMIKKYIHELLNGQTLGKKFKANDIGVVSPYKLQCNKLKDSLEDFTIGVAETFQGQEKLVMIISTVCSNNILPQFVQNERRINVMLTRAKALMIIIGNDETLAANNDWLELINF
ncbi:putative helicase MOV-10, partial [Contarinia nasturtii]|uniref:putative helicase MOV-10 n=1 Tax=Contarinia nasturtii TaxID=265458 RepID=UPI0012D42AB9